MSDPAQNEKNHAALNSVLAAFGLVTLKTLVGWASGSLGLLAEAAHSALDLAAAILTLFAVRAACKPPDPGHAYGHGKVENLSALAESLLLLATCGWIIIESIHRLVTAHANVRASVWTFLVMGISIAVDLRRSKMLYKAAEKHRSQALEADALHFSTDVWSSAVVILGLIGVKVSDWVPSLSWLQKADAVAALFVGAIVIGVSARLGFRTIEALIDASPAGVADRIQTRIEAIDEVFDCHAVRVRHSGPHYFVDLHVTMDGELSLKAAHDLTERVEKIVQEILPDADVTVHPEPRPPGSQQQKPE